MSLTSYTYVSEKRKNIMKYENEYLNELVFPIGGIGTGSIGINGAGLLRDFEIFNHPSKMSLNGYTHFGVRLVAEDGSTFTKVICGDEKKNFSGTYGQKNAHSHGFGFGLTSASMNGFSHFRKVSCECRYPVCEFTFEDDDFPGKITLRAFNPLIPQDSFNSSLPCAFFTLNYSGAKYRELSFAFSFGCPFGKAVNSEITANDFSGVTMKSAEPQDSTGYGDITIISPGKDVSVQTNWFRGSWCDDIVTFMNEFSAGRLSQRSYKNPGKDHATVMSTFRNSTEAEADLILTWNVPNCAKVRKGVEYLWKNWYATQFADSSACAKYCFENKESLLSRTLVYVDSMFGQSLPQNVVEAAANTVSVLRSPTVLRLEDGSFYGYEGAGENEGSCEGTCQHVWNYAYALCFLFPDLERSIRDNEFRYELQEDGAMYFRMGLPAGSPCVLDFPCFDGQMGSVIKTYREWKISGNDEWMLANLGNIKAALGFAFRTDNNFRWDADRDGFAEGRLHHTLDMELFGADGWLQGMYLVALKAATEMFRFAEDTASADYYGGLYRSGRKIMSEKLFNGEYFSQSIDLSDKNITDEFGCGHYWNNETDQIKYQIGEGCEIDQLLGQWHASVIGLGEIFDREQAESAAKSIYRYNFKKNMRSFNNAWRLFAVNDEAGTVICSFPERRKKPAIPVPYTEECMSGFEYAFAGALAELGMTDEAEEVVNAVRGRYDGSNRNPFNEIECGSNYARSMASFALIPILAGFTFDMSSGIIGFNPKINKEKFRSFWSVGKAWGVYEQDKDSFTLKICEGELKLCAFGASEKAIAELYADSEPLSFSMKNKAAFFDLTTIESALSGVFG